MTVAGDRLRQDPRNSFAICAGDLRYRSLFPRQPAVRMGQIGFVPNAGEDVEERALGWY